MQSVLIWIYCLPVPVIIAAAGLLTMVFLHLQDRWAENRWWKAALRLCAAAWLILTIAATVGNRAGGTGERIAEWIPFHSYRQVLGGGNREILRSNFMNVLLFYPAGLVLGAALPRRWRRWVRVLLIVLPGMAVSAGIEFWQYRYALGIAEIDDVIHNVLGMALGLLPCVGMFRRPPHP